MHKLINIEHWISDNDTKVYFIRRTELPMLEISVNFYAGSVYDGEKYGISHLTNSMLSQGTQSFTANELASNFKKVGANFSVNSDRDMATLYLRTLTEKKYLQPALHNFSNALHSPAFPSHELSRLQKLVVNAILQQRQMPNILARNAFLSAIYPEHPYRHSVLGTIEAASALSVNDLKMFFKTYYHGANAVITLVGDINLKQAEKIAHQLTRGLGKKTLITPIPLAARVKKKIEKRIHFPSSQTHIVIGQVGVNYQDPQEFPIFMGNFILGGTPLTSRLFKAVRGEHGLVYNIYSGFSIMLGRGPFFISLQTQRAETEKALTITKQVFGKFLKKGITTSELNHVKRKLINSFPLTLAQNTDISNHLLRIAFYNLPLNYLDDYCEHINSVTRKQIHEAYVETFDLDYLTTILVGEFDRPDQQRKIQAKKG